MASPIRDPHQLKKAAPDILLVDAGNPAVDFEVLGLARTLLPQTKVLLLTDGMDEDYQLQAMRQGACGFVSKDCTPDTLERALKRVAKGEIWVSHELATSIIGKYLQGGSSNSDGRPELSRREQETLALLAEGYRNKEIANFLSVTENTVRAHLTSLYRKIQVGSRVQAALYYFEKNKHIGHPRPRETLPPSSAPGSPFIVTSNWRADRPLRTQAPGPSPKP
jgi:two-component system nitrate/nitrite response regulator NarL